MSTFPNEKQIEIADPVNFQIVAIKNYAEIYFLAKHLGQEAYNQLVEEATVELEDKPVDKQAVGEWWNSRIGSPIFMEREIPPPPPLIILTDKD